jgi:limonene-1,2-epoxide hydrolase
MDPEKVVRDFCNAIPRRDAKELLEFFTPDAVYHNIPIAPVTGHEAIGATLRYFLDPSSEAEFAILGLACSGRTVFTERIDRFVTNGKKIELPVMGVFEVSADGRISAWRDYFDMATYTRQAG